MWSNYPRALIDHVGVRANHVICMCYVGVANNIFATPTIQGAASAACTELEAAGQVKLYS